MRMCVFDKNVSIEKDLSFRICKSSFLFNGVTIGK